MDKKTKAKIFQKIICPLRSFMDTKNVGHYKSRGFRANGHCFRSIGPTEYGWDTHICIDCGEIWATNDSASALDAYPKRVYRLDLV